MKKSLNVKKLSEWGIPFQKKFFIAGPCSAESEEQVIATAQELSRHTVSVFRAGIWKPRTRPGTFEGVGAEGLKWLKQAGKITGLPVATEVANARQLEQCLKKGIDMIWIGARTSTNPFAVQDIADALKGADIPVLIKNPMNADVELWLGAIERINKAGITRIMALHRGFATYRQDRYRNQPIWRVPIELRRRFPKLPIICDPSHICGNRKYISEIAQEALDFLFDGLMIEVHRNPDKALSDAKQQLTPRQYGNLIKNLKIKDISLEENDFNEKLSLLRNDIDTIDNNIIALLGKRMDDVKQIGELKQQNKVSLLQPARWDQIVKSRIDQAKEHSLNPDFVRDIYEHIHEEALTIQEEMGKAME
ncbi:MAG: 3-deoxy-7-phosphoheptulonate synthase [Chitinivibrionales bacterium]|nr:3-deoxy-7-phosphoheptulonate synthase [Chitinivibrionales bacterium]